MGGVTSLPETGQPFDEEGRMERVTDRNTGVFVIRKKRMGNE